MNVLSNGTVTLCVVLAFFTGQQSLGAAPRLAQTQSAAPGSQSPSPSGTPAKRDPAAGSTPATPDADGIYQVGNGVQPPKVIYSVDPEYTDLARRKKLAGISVVEAVVDAQGNPQGVHVKKSMGETVSKKLRAAAESLDRQAILSVSQYRFQPATYHGKPVPCRINVVVNFQFY